MKEFGCNNDDICAYHYISFQKDNIFFKKKKKTAFTTTLRVTDGQTRGI